MNSLILNRPITPEDILKERAVRAKVLYSPCQDNDIKWRYCNCFICRAVWDPTGEEDARIANAQREQHLTAAPKQDELEHEDEPVIPSSLPPAKDSDKTVTLTGSEVNTAVRLLGDFEKLLDRCVEKMTTRLEEQSRASEYLPVPPPELDQLFCTRTQVINLIHELTLKPMT
jgi:hypothetical protein